MDPKQVNFESIVLLEKTQGLVCGTELLPLSEARQKYPNLVYPKCIYDVIGFVQKTPAGRLIFVHVTFQGSTLIIKKE